MRWWMCCMAWLVRAESCHILSRSRRAIMGRLLRGEDRIVLGKGCLLIIDILIRRGLRRGMSLGLGFVSSFFFFFFFLSSIPPSLFPYPLYTTDRSLTCVSIHKLHLLLPLHHLHRRLRPRHRGNYSRRAFRPLGNRRHHHRRRQKHRCRPGRRGAPAVYHPAVFFRAQQPA